MRKWLGGNAYYFRIFIVYFLNAGKWYIIRFRDVRVYVECNLFCLSYRGERGWWCGAGGGGGDGYDVGMWERAYVGMALNSIGIRPPCPSYPAYTHIQIHTSTSRDVCIQNVSIFRVNPLSNPGDALKGGSPHSNVCAVGRTDGREVRIVSLSVAPQRICRLFYSHCTMVARWRKREGARSSAEVWR